MEFCAWLRFARDKNHLMSARLLPVLLLCAGMTVLALAPARAAETDADSKRRDFQTAQASLRAGDLARFKALRASLDGHVLAGYLDYESLKDRVEHAPVTEIRAFLAANSHNPGADAVRKRWLRLLAARGDWDGFLTD
jgi:soluble lytic murein transglycosylase